jgi:ATP phosphoribosyltransferase
VSTGVTLRENNLKEIEGGKVLESQGVLVANRRSLEESSGMLELVHELIERFEVCFTRLILLVGSFLF